MKVSGRETVLFLSTAAVLLFALSFFMIRPRIEEIGMMGDERLRIEREIAENETLLAEKGGWEQKMAERGQLLQQFPPDQKMDLYWRKKIEESATRYGVNIANQQGGENEDRQGDVYEMSFKYDWEKSSLEAVVRFLFELQNQGVMFGVRELVMRPKDGALLSGNLTVDCVYTRGAAPAN